MDSNPGFLIFLLAIALLKSGSGFVQMLAVVPLDSLLGKEGGRQPLLGSWFLS
jgi:hypothetical protein